MSGRQHRFRRPRRIPAAPAAARLVVVSALLACAPPSGAPRALASAWNRAAAEGFVSLDAATSGGSAFFDGAGRLEPARPYAKSEAAAYVEYGVTDKLMFVARPSFDLVSLGAPAGGTYRGLGATEIGAQYQALVFGPAVLAVLGSATLPGTTSRANPASIGNTARAFEARGLAGLSLALGPFPAFIETQQAFRLRTAGAAPQWQADAALGFRPVPRLLIMALGALVVPTGPRTAWFPSGRTAGVGLRAVLDLTTAVSISLTATTTLAGRDALRDRSLALGLWYRF